MQPVTMRFDVVESDSNGETQICGGPWVKQDVDGHPDDDMAQEAALAATAKRASGIAEAMSRSADERVRAVADLVASAGSFTADAACDAGSSCALTRAADEAQASAHRRHLIDMARATRDPQVYAWAYQSCDSPLRPADYACEALDATQWARLDPTNAVAWLAVASAASRRHDRAAVDDAMFHVANATRYDDGESVAASVVIDSLPADAEALLAAPALAGALTGRDWMSQNSAAMEALRYCDSHELGDANRRETCSRVGEVMLANARSLRPWSVGKVIGSRLDWPTPRQRALDDELASYKLVSPSRSSTRAVESYSCSGLRKMLDGVGEIARIGEMEQLRRAVLATGRPVSQLAEDFAAVRAKNALANEPITAATLLAAPTGDAASAARVADVTAR